MQGTYFQMPTHSLVLRNEILWRISPQPNQTNIRIFIHIFNHLVKYKSTEYKICSTFNSNIIHLPFDRHLYINFSLKPVASIYYPLFLHFLARKWLNTVAETGTSILCGVLGIKLYVFVCHYSSQFIFKIFFYSNQHTHNYLSECNPQQALRECRTCEVFNIVDKCKPQLQCNKSDILCMVIK